MSTEWGLFSDEGLIEGDYYSKEDAEIAATYYDPDDNIEVLEVCSEHPDQPRIYCEECDAEEEQDELDEAEDDTDTDM